MRTVISASRRSDLPAHYLDRMHAWIEQGQATVTNPFSGKVATVPLTPDAVHTLVFWSKNYGPFLTEGDFGQAYRYYFLFTINDQPSLEPCLPSLSSRLDQACELARRYGAERVGWRFDPVVFTNAGPVSPPESFRRIGERLAAAGISRAIVSFLDLYGKVRARNTRMGLGFVEPSADMRREYLTALSGIAGELGMRLELCCEDDPGVPGIARAACIDGTLLASLSGEPASLAKDPGQRERCGCTISRDIGSYRDMPCPSGCRYCYANPIIEPSLKGEQ